MTFSPRDLANRAMDGEKVLYVTAFLNSFQIKRALVDWCFHQHFAPPDIECIGYSTRKDYSRATLGSKDRVTVAT